MKNLQLKKLALIVVPLAVIVVAGLVAFRAFSSPISFTYYEPTYLPPNVTITDKRISIIDDGRSRSESAALRLETVA